MMRTILKAMIAGIALGALAGMLSGCTSVSYRPETGEARAVSVLQRRTLVVETREDGSLAALRYSSGSDPVVITTPYGAVGGVRE